MAEHSVLTLPGVFQHYFENHPDGMCVVDLQGHFVEANAAAFRMFGYTMLELSQTGFGELLGGYGALDSVHGQGNSERELAIAHKQGHWVQTRVTGVPLVSDGLERGHLLTLTDITEQRDQRRELADVHALFAFIAEHSQNIISSFSPDGVFTYVSPNVHALLGYTPEEVIGQPASAFNTPETNEALGKSRESRHTPRTRERFTGRLRHKNGTIRWYETTLQFLRDPSGAIIQTIGVGRDITDRKEAEEKIEYMAYHDTLTDLPNRRLFRTRVSRILEKSGEQRHVLMLLDLDGFKQVNDTLGHDIGDALLIEVARRLTRNVGKSGIVARLGGDEFTVFYENVESRLPTSELIDQMKDVTSEPIVIDGNVLRLTASIGIAWVPEDGTSLETLMRSADVAMYSMKQGQNPM